MSALKCYKVKVDRFLICKFYKISISCNPQASKHPCSCQTTKRLVTSIEKYLNENAAKSATEMRPDRLLSQSVSVLIRPVMNSSDLSVTMLSLSSRAMMMYFLMIIK
ncbi:hypothetical protein T02_2468 [Trichinella nativa]|uniref:Uncharacterized protein n=1 Tax=Trichinella nativa TaxID=6335 RepID=A0A0V1KZZ2_9BILA|nr:hypothetical protein T06_16545 [Trichinella sp. T6]KRZ52857.1 hypothetical protein T02_2468 [Trichinella nativa]